MAPKLKNKPLQQDEVRAYAAAMAIQHQIFEAEKAAKEALKEWYSIGYNRANAELPKIQVNSNLKEVAQMPGWQKRKGSRNGYIMLTSLLNGTLRPMIVVLDYEENPTGGLTFRHLHQQVRETLQLEAKTSLRMCPFKPWHRHMQNSIPVQEHKALPASDIQCRHLLGTTLIYYTYVHLTE